MGHMSLMAQRDETKKACFKLNCMSSVICVRYFSHLEFEARGGGVISGPAEGYMRA